MRWRAACSFTALCLAAMPPVAGGRARPATQPAALAPGDLRITLLGTGNPRPSMERFGPSTLVEAGGRRLLVDVGRGASIRLLQVGDGALLTGVDTILFTHLHADHVVGFPDLWLTGWLFGRVTPLAVIGPPGTSAMVRHLEQAFAFDVGIRQTDERLPASGAAIDALDAGPGVVHEREGLRVTAFEVDHRPVAPAYGYRVDFRGRSVAFSGDTRATETIVEQARGVDVIVHEVISPEVERRRALIADPAVVERIIERHTTPEQAGRLFSRIGPRLAVYSHIVPTPTTAEDLVEPTRRTYAGPLEVGEDLMTITVGERIAISRAARRP